MEEEKKEELEEIHEYSNPFEEEPAVEPDEDTNIHDTIEFDPSEVKEEIQEVKVEEIKVDEPTITIAEEAPKVEEPVTMTREERLAEKEVVVEEKKEEPKKKSNKKPIIIFIVLIMLIGCGIGAFLLLSNGDKKKEDKKEEPKEEKIDYEAIMLAYGEQYEQRARDYIVQNKTNPDLDSLAEYVKVEKHVISCSEKELSKAGKLYLGGCTIDGSEETYSYGEKVVVEGAELDIYLNKWEGNTYYDFSKDEDAQSSKKVYTLKCISEKCKGYYAYDTYALVEENGVLNLYNYKKNEIVAEDVVPTEGDFESLTYEDKLYGFFKEVNGKNYIYSVKNNESYRVKGDLDYMGMNQDLTKEGLVILLLNDRADVVEIDTGEISFSLYNSAYSFTDEATAITYIVEENVVDEDNNYSETIEGIYTTSGKKLISGEFDKFYAYNGSLVLEHDNCFDIYNSSGKKVSTSPEFDRVIMLDKSYALVLDANALKIVNYNGKELATFIEEWDEDRYYVHTMLSGWYTTNDKYGIYVVVEDSKATVNDVYKDIDDMSKEELKDYDLGYEYYYIPKSGETGKIGTYIGGYAKPVLYLYPTFPTQVKVTFAKPNNLTTTYPKYNNSWSVLAMPNGDLVDAKGNYYYALYWEEKQNHRVDFSEGFYVEKDNAIDFLESKLTQLGFTARERNEFIMYWLPILENNGKNLVYFELTDERDSYSKINISPKPDSVLRVAMHVKKVDKKVNIKEQKLPKFERKGFTVVEWGGVQY